ncbi:hypothetical protein EMPS_00294 [Entomortierella parvispora]|uniref:Uncharacterized protein n=1 Tax=Entomortierella parvispora TaxID=205924 RepID=A0A9P3H1E9_9FUNG|nr:hypothetical protein EMPS_00294 [Entomortierella parvispora]
MSTQKDTTSSKKAPNTLSSIVSNLVRSAIGGGNKHDHVPDEDLDKYVADMIMMSAAESRAKYEKYGLTGSKTTGSDIGPSSSNDKIKLASGVVIDRADSNGLKTNKRFLSSIIKNTDSHNQALIRSEEKRAAEAAKELIADLDRRAAERERESGRRRPNTERMYRPEDWRHPDRLLSSSKSSKLSLSSRSKARNSDPPRSGRMRMDEISVEGETESGSGKVNQSVFSKSGGDLKADSDTWKKTPQSPDSGSESGSESSISPSSDSKTRSRSSRSRLWSISPEDHDRKSKGKGSDHSRDHDRPEGISSSRTKSESSSRTKSKSSSSSGSKLGSRMDKYFQEGYDPLLDVHDEDEGSRAYTTHSSKNSKKSKKRKSTRKEEKSKRSSDGSSRHKSKRHRHRSESQGSGDDEDDEKSEKRRRKSRRRDDTDSEDEQEYDRSHKTSSSRSSRSHRKSHRGDSDSDTNNKEAENRKGSSLRSLKGSYTEDEDRRTSSKKKHSSRRLDSGSESDVGRRESSSSRAKRRRH